MNNIGHYVAAKHGVVGLMRTLALELAPDYIRVNSVHPTSVNTDMIQNAATYELFAPDLPEAERDQGDARGALPGDERAADPVGGAGRHLQRRAVAGLGRVALRHRPRAEGRRRADPSVAAQRSALTSRLTAATTRMASISSS